MKTQKAIKERLSEIETEKPRCAEFIQSAEAEHKRLSDAIAAQEAERETAAAAVTTDALAGDGDVRGVLHKLLTLKSHEPALHQLRDSVAKLGAAISETKKKLKSLHAEEARLNAEELVLENVGRVKAAEKHFRAMCSSWKDVERDHAEFIRLLAEVKASGADMRSLLQYSEISGQSFFGVVVDSPYTLRHSAVELVFEFSQKSGIFGNEFYHAEGRPPGTAQSEFKRGHVFNGAGFTGRMQ